MSNARERVTQLTAQLQAAQDELNAEIHAERISREYHRSDAELRAMPVHVLREHVASCARTHGHQCAIIGHANTTSGWMAFRDALRVLAERAGAE